MNAFIRWTITLAALVSTGYAEYKLATHLDWDWRIAIVLPLVLDLYLVHAVRQRKDVPAAVTAVILVSATSYVVAHELDQLTPVRIAVSSIAPVILWRIEATMRHDVEDAAEWRKRKIWDLPAGETVTPVSWIDDDMMQRLKALDWKPETEEQEDETLKQEDETPPHKDETSKKREPRWPNRLSDEDARHMALEAFVHNVSSRDAEDAVTRSHSTIARMYKQFEAEGVKRMELSPAA